jgi:hypothetical protein
MHYLLASIIFGVEMSMRCRFSFTARVVHLQRSLFAAKAANTGLKRLGITFAQYEWGMPHTPVCCRFVDIHPLPARSDL